MASVGLLLIRRDKEWNGMDQADSNAHPSNPTMDHVQFFMTDTGDQSYDIYFTSKIYPDGYY